MNDSRLAQRYHQGRAWLRRTQPGAMAVRTSVYVTGFLAVVTAAAPAIGAARAAGFALVLPILPTVRPMKVWPTALIVTCVAVWALTGEHSYALAFLLGALLYTHHTSAAQAVTMRTDTYVTPEVVTGWARRTGLVLLAAAAASALVGLLPRLFGRTDAIAYGLAGLAAVVGLGGVLAWLVFRKL
ncbi:hypothetical protein [Phytomonospora endophytica]|uniref:Uncharacterized protein n=1 Tax=Phytomonospora endophytica TaxID=714109 RepID=A0A841FX13_9ACTN|nr:hypothetical protein [Phytomonospora endophytica]MBB6036510.1 hypothetical protein [Phytomonospora endophytica]GIG65832.1 hypothetical protein Pen01_21270 [Phytomonospora endophytica]